MIPIYKGLVRGIYHYGKFRSNLEFSFIFLIKFSQVSPRVKIIVIKVVKSLHMNWIRIFLFSSNMSFFIFGMSHKAGLCENKTQILKWSLGYICMPFYKYISWCSFLRKCSQIIKEDILSKYRTSNEYCRRTIDMSLKSDKTEGEVYPVTRYCPGTI